MLYGNNLVFFVFALSVMLMRMEMRFCAFVCVRINALFWSADMYSNFFAGIVHICKEWASQRSGAQSLHCISERSPVHDNKWKSCEQEKTREKVAGCTSIF